MEKNQVTSFVGGKVGGGANVGTGLENIKKGDILIVDANSGAVLTGGGNTITTHPEIAIAHAIVDGQPILSGTIYGKSLTEGAREDYVAPVQKVSYFSVPDEGAEDQIFSGAIVFPTDLRIRPNKQERLEFTAYSKGGYDLAKKLKEDINRVSDNNPKINGQQLVLAVVAATGTQANIGTAATADVSNMSKTVTFGAAHGLSVGDIVYFPNGGVYTVASVTSTTVIQLDSVYVGPTETYVADTVKELTDVTEYGVRVYGQAIPRTNPVDKYSFVTYEIGLDEKFETSEVVETAPVRGTGMGWQVRDKEVSCMGWNGYTDRRDTMRAEYPFVINPDSNYNTVSLSYEAPVRGDLQQTFSGPTAVFLAFDEAADTQINAVMGILAPWASSGGVDLT